MDQTRLRELLEKLASDRITAEELHRLMQAIQDDTYTEELDQALRRFQDLPIVPHLDDQEQSLKSYQRIISDKRFLQARKQKRLYLTWVAASLALILVGALLYQRLSSPREHLRNAFTTTWTAPLGEQRQIELPDGTSVWLNAGSRLDIPRNYNDNDRRVVLAGEAYFDVQSNKQKPFTVETGSLITKVLGTAFNINSFDASHIAVTVRQGKIAVQHEAETVSLLTANQQLIYNVHTNHKQVRNVNATAMIAWIHQRLRFDNISMADAGKALERWSNKTFIYRNDAIRGCHFTVSFHEGENLREMLNVISALNNFKYEIKNDTVYLDGNGCE
ncbi:FecR family protein [Olivibacter jilunii]|uniref:FecR family protein n=1 Tax=Olivibacter jilunii TaxID=985016 RepID=UPI003F1906AC